MIIGAADRVHAVEAFIARRRSVITPWAKPPEKVQNASPLAPPHDLPGHQYRQTRDIRKLKVIADSDVGAR